ncbi:MULTISPECIES: ABC transporter permease [Paenibacillus]|uniref:ABC transporter permease n=1 Tax=Paenibacillus TaxID=44249 RepID=UPI00048E57AA|nr:MULTISPECIES: ABC transporter permease [Paenibacillus]MDU0332125.1 ABC transporter permease [Paenibacillus sp. 3LSP]
MRKFTPLVVNEWLKMSKKKSFIVPYTLIAAAIAGMLYMMYAFSQEKLGFLDFASMAIARNGLGQMTTLLVIICTAGIVAKEHSLGTIKLLLIRSQSRSRILASKYVAVLLFTLSLFVFSLAVALLGGGLVYGFGSASVQGISWSEVLTNTLYSFIYTVVYVTITFLASILTRSTGATIGIGMFLVVLEELVVALLSRYAFAKYLIFANADLSVYLNGNPPMPGMTLTFSSVVIAAYLVLFLAVSFVTFKKRDVA